MEFWTGLAVVLLAAAAGHALGRLVLKGLMPGWPVLLLPFAVYTLDAALDLVPGYAGPAQAAVYVLWLVFLGDLLYARCWDLIWPGRSLPREREGHSP